VLLEALEMRALSVPACAAFAALALAAGCAARAQVPAAEPSHLAPSKVELEVPFAYGTEVQVSQAHGTFSHTGRDYWGWDFRAPAGAPVLAARAGIVRLARGSSTRGGCFREAGPWANYVIIDHGNGYETQYLHFSHVFVSPGQRVQAGEVIGLIGATGFSCGTHLHFQLQRSGGSWAGQSVAATFRGIGDPEVDRILTSRNRSPWPSPLQARR
jgi:murein DD-endopeptidase MepM/ murein hydrolase activator NlpD